MASTYTDIGTELMTTGENAGSWGTKTNTNLKIIEEAVRGYVAQSIAGGAQTTALTYTDGSTGDAARNMVIALTGTITGNQVVTVTAKEKMWIVDNQTSGAYTVQFMVSGQTGVTWAATDKGTKILYNNGTDVIDSFITSVGTYDLNGGELTLDADSDTSITASTDDQIDFEIAGADDFTMTANAFNILTGSHATFADSANAKFGTGNDMLVYHDGTNSYITNAVGALKIATETSGIAVTIGHTTSEVTIADNLTVTGTLTLGSNAELTEAELEFLDGITAGTAAASKALVLDSNKDIGTIRNLTIDGTFSDGNYTFDTSGNVTGLGTVASGNITSSGTVQGTTITATTAFVPDASDGAALGTTALEFSDLFLADEAVINFGDDQEVTLTHVQDAGLLLNSSNYLTFRDSALKISSSADGQLDIDADTEVEITATTVDLNGILDVSGVLVAGGQISASDGTAGAPSISNTGDLNTGFLFSAADTMQFSSGGTAQVTFQDGAIVPVTDDDIDLGTASLQFKDVYVDGTLEADAITIGGSAVVSSPITALNNATANELVTVGGTTTELDAEANLTFTGSALTCIGTVTVGVDNTGHDVKFFGATTGKSLLWDESADSLIVTGTTTLVGTTNLDAVDIDGAVQIDATFTSGVDGQGYDTKFFGDTASAYMLWDTSTDDLILAGGAGLIVPEGQFTLGSTAVASTATELNLLDGAGVLKEVGKESIWVPSNAMTPTETNGAERNTVETTATRPDMQVLDFDKDSDEYAQFAIAFPKQWNLGTVTFQAFWSGIAATSDVDWGVQAVAMNDNETIDVAFGTAVVVTDNAQGAVEELLVSAESSAITIAGTPADDDLTYFQIYRDVSGDDMDGDARLHGVKIFYTTDAANDA